MAWIAINIAIFGLYLAWWIRVLTSEYQFYNSTSNPALLSNSAAHLSLASNYPNFSIIIAYRDEQLRIQPLLESIPLLQFHGDWEVIFVNDHSTDLGPNTINQWIKAHPSITVKHINNVQSGKKSAIQLGVENAQNNWILTTDADCKLPIYWLQSFSEIIQNQPNAQMIIGRVGYDLAATKHLLSTYEILENQFLIALNWKKTKRQQLGFVNGANLCYKKETFIELGGMQSHIHIASGDDTFTAEKFHIHFPNGIFINANPLAIVTTYTQTQLSDFCNQRLRWFKKSFLQKSQKTTVEQAFLAGILLAIWGLIAYAVYADYGIYALLPLATKALADFIFGSMLLHWNNTTKKCSQLAASFRLRFNYQYLRIPIASAVQTFLLPILGLIAPFLQFRWKNRKYKA